MKKIATACLAFLFALVAAGQSNLGVTVDAYNAIDDGMTYPQVRQIIGLDGSEMARNSVGGYETVMILWDAGLDGNMNIMFQNGRVVSKAQYGLKAARITPMIDAKDASGSIVRMANGLTESGQAEFKQALSKVIGGSIVDRIYKGQPLNGWERNQATNGLKKYDGLSYVDFMMSVGKDFPEDKSARSNPEAVTPKDEGVILINGMTIEQIRAQQTEKHKAQ